MSRQPSHRGRRGFTLIEMLVVIFIIGILVSLMIVGLQQAMVIVREGGVLNEVNNLTSAMQNYKSDTQGYPPCMGDAYSNVNDNNAGRQARFVLHLRQAYPRYNPGTYTNVRNVIINAANGYNYLDGGGNLQPLDLNTMDQAEALVFWLGGFPTPYRGGNRLSSRKLFGFHTNPANPFQIDVATGGNIAQLATQYRTSPAKYYDFDDMRLTDHDFDGWLEYGPNINPMSSRVPPFVYFDAALYGQASWSRGMSPTGTMLIPPYIGYPHNTSANFADLLGDFGLAVPYATFVDPNNTKAPIQWANPLNFQILHTGLDCQYGASGVSTVRLPVMTSGTTYRGANFGSVGGYDDEENDNLTSFSVRRLGNSFQNQ